jgi:hypothetical protein
MFCTREKNNLREFQNHRYIGIFMFLRERGGGERGRVEERGREQE